MMALRVLLSLLLSLPLLSFAQGVSPVSPVSPTGTRLFPNAFASSDNIAAQTATAMHGLVYIWDGSNWDRWTGAVTVTGSVAVTGTFWQATQPVSGTVSANQAGTWTVQPGNTANTTPWLVNEFPSTGVIAGQRYYVVIDLPRSGSPWRDGRHPVGVAGKRSLSFPFPSNLLMSAAVPLRRVISANWLEPVIEIRDAEPVLGLSGYRRDVKLLRLSPLDRPLLHIKGRNGKSDDREILRFPQRWIGFFDSACWMM